MPHHEDISPARQTAYECAANAVGDDASIAAQRHCQARAFERERGFGGNDPHQERRRRSDSAALRARRLRREPETDAACHDDPPAHVTTPCARWCVEPTAASYCTLLLPAISSRHNVRDMKLPL